MNTTYLLKFIMLLHMVFALGLFAGVTIKHMPHDSSLTIPSIDRSETKWVSIPDFASQLGYSWRWNFFTQNLTLNNNSQRVVFSQNTKFYRVGSELLQIPVAPIRKGGTVYLPLNLLVDIFQNDLFIGTISWQEGGSELIIRHDVKSVKSIISEDRESETLVTISLSDSSEYAFSYVYPRLVVTLQGVRADAGELQGEGQGAVDSILVQQHEHYAEIAFILNKRVKKPQFQYKSGPGSLQFSLIPVSDLPPTITEVEIQELRRIVIDPGHGGRDPGAIGPTGVMEKDVALGLSLALRDKLQSEGFEVFMTRDTDVFIPLRDRTQFANDKRADLFISIHANSIGGSQARRDNIRGYKTYFLSQARNEHERLAAMRENAVIELEDKPQGYDFLQSVLIDLAGNEYLRQSQEFCIIIDQVMSNGPISNRISKLHLGVGQANFWVLNGAYMPSVLFEAGFISNPREEQLLKCSEFQKEMASALTQAVLQFKHQLETGL
ncbi:N-acetylmuramoyl-L-alanine amidase [Chitinispirillum alkaliphilum]|nr:N-acetylmuramoyl-L-alanine amidase [Chitinispirillum alkaliphilum]